MTEATKQYDAHCNIYMGAGKFRRIKRFNWVNGLCTVELVTPGFTKHHIWVHDLVKGCANIMYI